nr:polysaccharide deacetylase family protein [uncultured Hoeflea sp.]
MSGDSVWKPLMDELDRWQACGRVAAFWLRDDDAVVPTRPLERLVAMTARTSTPLTLAVIPKDTDAALSDCLGAARHVTVAVHGWSHTNHAGSSGKKQELGLHRPRQAVLGDLAAGFDKLSGLYGAQFGAMLVPPWNRIDSDLLPDLSGLGYKSVSVFGREKPALIRMINTHVDLIDWHGSRGGRDPSVLVQEIVARLQTMFEDGGHMGFLTHHLVHDEPAWRFLDALLDKTSQHRGCRWMAAGDLQAPNTAAM